MKLILQIIGILFIVLFLYTCSRDDGNETTNNNNPPIDTTKNDTTKINPPFLDKYVIELTHDYIIDKVTYYISDKITFIMKFTYYPDSVSIIKTNDKGHVTEKSKYYLNRFGLADSSFDSLYDGSKVEGIISTKYEYDANNYKVLAKGSKKYDTFPVFNFDNIYYIENGNNNAVYINRAAMEWYIYSTLCNKIDIFNFIGSFNGNLNRNLTSSYITHYGGPHTTGAISDYTYKLNSDSLVTERTEFYTPGYDFTKTYLYPKKRAVTTYEYIFK